MSDDLTEAVKAGARAMADDWNPERDPTLTDMFRDNAGSAIRAVAPIIREQAKAEERERIGERLEEMAAQVSLDPLYNDPACHERAVGIRTGYLLAAREIAAIARGGA